jgi:voltage-gated potassium channel
VTRRPFRKRWVRPLVSVIALFVAYYAWPVRQEGADLAIGILVTLIAIGFLGWAIAGQIRRHLVRGEPEGLPTLIILVAAVIVVFAFAYYRLEIHSPGQMADLHTKTDSLYFTMQLLTTVGLGDVSAQGQLARSLALVQMVFDVIFVAAAGSMLATTVKERLREGAEQRDDSPSSEDG